MRTWTIHKLLHITPSILIALAFMVILFSNCVYADDIIYERGSELGDPNASEADNITVTLKDNGDDTYSAVVSGDGEMKDYARNGNNPGPAPWITNYKAKISSVTVGSGVTHIGDYAFNGASILSGISLEEGLISIGQMAFTSCKGVTDVSIPKSVISIGNGAFASANNLVVTVLGNETVFTQTAYNSGPGKKVIAYEDSKTAANWTYTFSNGRDNSTALELLPSYIYTDDAKDTVTKYLASGKDVVLPDGVRVIGEDTFSGNSDIVSVNLNKVNKVSQNAFHNCTNLNKAIIPATVETIDQTAFSGCDQLIIYGNGGTIAESYANDYGFEFNKMRPYRVSDTESFEKTLPTGANDMIDLSSIFAVDYDSTLKYQAKIGDSDYTDIDGSSYTFEATEAGTTSIEFRAVDSFGEPSDDTYTAQYIVENNTAPELKKEEIEVKALFYERPQVNIAGIFDDADGDELTFRFASGDKAFEEINWDLFDPPRTFGDASNLSVTDGIFSVPQSWTQYPGKVGKEQIYYVRAYDKWNVPSKECLTVKVTTHSVNIKVSKGEGVHSLDTISFKFARGEAEDIVTPSYIAGNNYYFDLDYVVNETGSYGGGYDYTYEIALDGCESVTGTYTTKNDNGEAMNGPHTIEVTLSNPNQAAKDEQSVADVKDLIGNLGEVTLGSEEAIAAAQDAYDALFDDLKPQVTNYNVLLQARITLAELKLNQAEKERDAANKDKKDAEDKIQEAEGEIKAANEELAAAKAELDALKLTVKGLKVTSKKRKFTVKWKKNTSATGYTVQYKLSGAKKFKILKTLTKTKAVTKKLKKGKKYEFRVATYKKVNGKKVFGKWTEVKIVKCK